MSNSKINLQIGRGTSTIGNIVQGNGNRVSTNLSVQDSDKARLFEAFFSKIEQFKTGEASRDREIVELMRSIEDLRAKIAISDGPPSQSIGKMAKNLYDNYGWAAKPLKDLFDTIAPDWISQMPPQIPLNV